MNAAICTVTALGLTFVLNTANASVGNPLSHKLSRAGGIIQSNKDFHTELIATSSSSIAVFIYDSKSRPSKVNRSAVDVRLERNGDTLNLACSPSELAMHCELPLGATAQPGALVVHARPNGTKLAVSRFELPLKSAR
jgi:hypothetical protein